MTDKLDLLDYYTLIGVTPSASDAEIRKSFRGFARKYHPDRFIPQGDESVERAGMIYRRGSEAFQTLTDPIARAAYDSLLEQGRVRISLDEKEAAHASARAKRAANFAKFPVKSPKARQWFKVAVEASKRHKWEEAVSALESALEAEPNNGFLKQRLGKIRAYLRG